MQCDLLRYVQQNHHSFVIHNCDDVSCVIKVDRCERYRLCKPSGLGQGILDGRDKATFYVWYAGPYFAKRATQRCGCGHAQQQSRTPRDAIGARSK